MSIWHPIKTEDIDIDHKYKEMDLLVCSDHGGNVYAILTFDQIKDIYHKIISEDD